MNNLKNKVVLVTGGGQGLGEQITRVLAKEGATVIAGDIKDNQVQKLAEELTKAGQKVEGFRLDVGEEKSIQDVVDAIIKKHNRIDILVNNAGIDVTKSQEEMTIEEFDRVMRVNLRGPFVTAKIVLSGMYEKKFGHIVNICSTAAKRSWPNASAYHASKWGLLGMSHSLYTEAREKNVKVSAVIAGGMRTPFILERFPDTPLEKLQDPKNVAEVVKLILLTPDETIIPEVMVIPLHESSWP